MALIEWSDDLSVKVKELDVQHQKLIAMINDLNDAMKQRKGKDVIAGIINNLFFLCERPLHVIDGCPRHAYLVRKRRPHGRSC